MSWQVTFRQRLAPHDPYAGHEAPTLTIHVLSPEFEDVPKIAREKLAALVRIPEIWLPVHVSWNGGAYEDQCPF